MLPWHATLFCGEGGRQQLTDEQAAARRAGAARLLGISRPTIYALMDTHGMSRRGAELPVPSPGETT